MVGMSYEQLAERLELRCLLTEEEVQTVILAALSATPYQTDEDVQKLTAWAVGARFQEAVLQMVLGGRLATYIQDGEVYYKVMGSEAAGDKT